MRRDFGAAKISICVLSPPPTTEPSPEGELTCVGVLHDPLFRLVRFFASRIVSSMSKHDNHMKMHFTIAMLLPITLLVWSCGKPAPTVSTDGYELTNLPGSNVQIAVKSVNSVKQETGYFLDGQKTGLWLTYQPDGRIAQLQHFVAGKLNGPVLVFDQRGQITSQTDYADGLLDGNKSVFKFGNVQEEVPYVKGKMHGTMKKYYPNKKLMEEIDYKNNVQDGYYRHYNEEGVMDLEYVYKNGEKVSGGIVNQ